MLFSFRFVNDVMLSHNGCVVRRE